MLIKPWVFISGAIVGSFLNVCIHRIPRRESIVMPSSHCPHCLKEIRWYDNIPLVSYLALGGRCRHCREKISIRYFVVEALTACSFVWFYAAFGISAKLFLSLIFVSLLIVASFVDFERQEIPDEVSVGGIVIGMIISAIFPQALHGMPTAKAAFIDACLGVVIGGGALYIIGFIGEIIFRKEAMGGGDVKLLAMIGSFLGWKMAILTFFIAPVFGSVVGIILKIKKGTETIPYGPYLSLAAVISIFFGEWILRALFYGIRG